MEPMHYIFTRFSVFLMGSREWKIGLHSSDNDTVKDLLFSETRLSKKFEFFERMTYPSIKNQTYKKYLWYLFTSKDLPQKYKDRLELLSCENIKIVYLNPTELLSSVTNDIVMDKTNFTTITLDDDDGLVPTFLEKLNLYTSQTGKIITFPFGMLYSIVDGKLVFGGKHQYRNINLGLAAIGFNIFTTGNHYTVDERFDVIIDNTLDMYWLCCSDVCDTKRKFSHIKTVKKQ